MTASTPPPRALDAHATAALLPWRALAREIAELPQAGLDMAGLPALAPVLRQSRTAAEHG